MNNQSRTKFMNSEQFEQVSQKIFEEFHMTASDSRFVTREIDELLKLHQAKIKMPKVFDDFAKQFDLGSQQDEKGLDDALSQILDIYVYGNEEFDDLEDYMRNTGDEEFYADCVKALIFGYEVEK